MKKEQILTFLFLAMFSLAGLAPRVQAAATTQSASGMSGMEMSMPEESANFQPTRQAFTTDHQFLVKLLSLPTPIPFEKYFQLRFAVYDGQNPTRQIQDATLLMFAGMRHGRKHGFAHGMQSSAQVEARDGVFVVSGMYFHMRGPWVLKITVQKGARKGIAYFRLPCCGR